MADVADIVCLGFGSWSRANALPTLGFAIGEASVPTKPGLEFTMPENRMHFTMAENKMHLTMPENRMHFTMPEDD